MGLWQAILRLFGLTSDTRVQISAPGIDVVITGSPSQVRSLLAVVKNELEKGPRGHIRKRFDSSEVVRPTELDEMDSPYALPGAILAPVKTDDRSRGKEEHDQLLTDVANLTENDEAPPFSSGDSTPGESETDPELEPHPTVDS